MDSALAISSSMRGRIDAVVARRNCRRRADAHVDFAGSGFAHEANNFSAGGAAHDAVVHEHDALAIEKSAHGI